MTNVVISAPIQSFFAWRIWRFVQSIWIPILICLLAAASLGGGIWTAVRIITLREFVYKPLLHTPALVWLVTAAAADILITVSLVYNLYVKKTGDALTDDLLDRMSALTIRTGLLTALFAILDVIFFLSLPHTTMRVRHGTLDSSLETKATMMNAHPLRKLLDVPHLG
ncbi:hypothetical protein H0H93_016377 [Arthromyces matolae]|nr:hypothetical protein H0H93_016377 [Arthromyces matolae]